MSDEEYQVTEILIRNFYIFCLVMVGAVLVVVFLRRKRVDEAVRWNPWNKVVQDHRDGTIDMERTNEERAKRGLAVPWSPEIADRETREPIE